MRPPSRLRTVSTALTVGIILSLVPAPTITAEGAEPHLRRIERIADTVDFDWRAHGVTFHIGCSEALDHCPPAAYETATRRILIAKRSLEDREYLAYLVLHELAHAWQFSERGWRIAQDDLARWGRSGVDGLEAGADCIAAIWGAARTGYWDCPADAIEHLREHVGVPGLAGPGLAGLGLVQHADTAPMP